MAGDGGAEDRPDCDKPADSGKRAEHLAQPGRRVEGNSHEAEKVGRGLRQGTGEGEDRR